VETLIILLALVRGPWLARTHSRAAIALPQRALRSVPEYLRRG